MGHFFTYIFLTIITFIFQIIPFGVLYFISDLVYFLMYYVIGYRKKVVFQNLKNSFPGKSEKEIIDISKKFYHHFCDISLESIKGLSISEQQILKRYKILNPEIANRFFKQNKDIMVLASHYCNWEWGMLACDKQFEHTCAYLYKPLTNKYVQDFSIKRRSRFGGDFVSIDDTVKYFGAEKPKPVLYVMAADQSPSSAGKAYWTQFLNQDTGFLHGPEKYASGLNMPVVFFDIRRVKRGFYEVKVSEISDSPKYFPKGKLTKIYADLVEQVIRKKPEDWLWTHKRWKRKMPEGSFVIPEFE